MKHVNYFNIIGAIVMVVVVVLENTSCRPDSECVENTTVGLVCEFRRPYKDKTGQTQYIKAWDSITVQGIGNAEMLYNNAKSQTKLTLLMLTDEDSTMYTLIYRKKTDTLIVRHTNQQQFISVECGCIYEHDLLEINSTHLWIDSIEILTDTMRRSGVSNVIIWGK